MKQAVRFLRPYRRHLVVGPTFKLIEAILELLLPIVMKKLIDDGVQGQNPRIILQMGVLMLIVSILGLVSAWVCQYTASVASQSYGTQIRNALFAKIQSLSSAEINQFGVPSLTTRLTNDTNLLQQGVALLIRLVVRAPFICIGSIVMVAMLDRKLAWIVMVATPCFAVILWLIMSKTTPLFQYVQARLDALGRILRENLSGVRVIRAFARQKEETERFETANDQHVRLARRVGTMAALANPMTMLIMNMAVVATIWFGGVRVNEGMVTTGTLVAMMNYMVELVSTLVVLADLVVLYTRVFGAAQRVGSVFDVENTIRNGDMVLSVSNRGMQNPLIAYKHVDFKFPDGADNALTDIHVSIHAGQTIGIIGGTGSGKSILVNLLARMYDVTGGSICIQDEDIRRYTRESLRETIAMVPQKSVLISGTVADNLRWGKPDATEEEMWKALDMAQASFVREKGGLQTTVERGGLNFSGGQRQRLAIARALVRQPQILILDDSSSALDFATDAALRIAIRKYAQDMTVLIVSQRASAIMASDQIMVMDDGKIVGEGTHQELLASCTIYAEIVALQLKEAEESR